MRERLAQLLAQKGWTGAELARRLGEHRNWVNNRLSGAVDIKAEEVKRIADALEIEPCALLREPNREERQRERRVAELREGYVAQWAREGVREDLVRSGLRALERLSEEDRRAIIAFARLLERLEAERSGA